MGVLFLKAHLSASQWLGFAVVLTAITALSWHERNRPPAVVSSGPIRTGDRA